VENEKLSIWLSFTKFFLGTFCIGVITIYVNNDIQEKEVALMEMEQLGKFIDHAITKDEGTRLRFAQYFASVTRSPELKKGWADYSAIVQAEIDTTKSEIKMIADKLEHSKSELEKIKLEMRLDKLESKLVVTPETVPIDTGYIHTQSTDYYIQTELMPKAIAKSQYIELTTSGYLTIKAGYKFWIPNYIRFDTESLYDAILVYSALVFLMDEEKLPIIFINRSSWLFEEIIRKDGLTNSESSDYLWEYTELVRKRPKTVGRILSKGVKHNR